MTESMSEDEILHYGVKGMKWGVTRARDQIAASRKNSNINSAVRKAVNKQEVPDRLNRQFVRKSTVEALGGKYQSTASRIVRAGAIRAASLTALTVGIDGLTGVNLVSDGASFINDVLGSPITTTTTVSSNTVLMNPDYS